MKILLKNKIFLFITTFILLSISFMSEACAANIFIEVRDKVYETLSDLRTIIYLVGGFGLIAFTFAAVFGRIDFKRLATICFSLFLVSAMGLFIKEFSGDVTSETKLPYKDYTSSDNSTAPDDSPSSTCKNGKCPNSSEAQSGESGGVGHVSSGGSSGAGGSSGDGTSGSSGTGFSFETIGQNTGGGQSASGMPSSYGTVGSSSANVDTRTGWQKFKDTIGSIASEGSKTVHDVGTVVSSTRSINDAIDASTRAVGNIGSLSDILNAGSTITSSIGSIASNTTDINAAVNRRGDEARAKAIDSEINRLRTILESNPANAEEIRQRIGELQREKERGNATAQTRKQWGQIIDATRDAQDVINTGRDIHNTYDNAVGIGKSIGIFR